jgi:hypothetical protein
VSVLALTATGGSGVTGSVVLATAGDRTAVSVRVVGAPPDADLTAAIHAGTCESGGDVVFTVAGLRADAQGVATASATVEAPLDQLLAAPHYVAVHAGPLNPPVGLACGPVGATRLPATGRPAGAAALARGTVALSGLLAGVALLTRRGRRRPLRRSRAG